MIVAINEGYWWRNEITALGVELDRLEDYVNSYKDCFSNCEEIRIIDHHIAQRIREQQSSIFIKDATL